MKIVKHIIEHAALQYPSSGLLLPRSPVPQNSLLLFDDITPTIFCDLSKTTAGTGTLSDPYQPSQLQAVMAGDKAGTILGLKRGSVKATTVGEILFPGLGSTDPERPVIIAPYGSGAPPLMECGSIVTDWVDFGSGGIWSRGIGTNVHEVWQSNRRIYQLHDSTVGNTTATQAADIAVLTSAGAGYAFINRDTDTMFIIPYDGENPNLGQIYTSNNNNGIKITVRGVAGTQGNIILAGLEVRHSRLSAIQIEVQNANPTGLSNVVLVGNRGLHCGVDINTSSGSEGSFITFSGLSDTVRHTDCRIDANYCEDIGNNLVESYFVNGCQMAWNVGVDCCGHGIAELYRSNSNVTVMYGKAIFKELLNINIGAQTRGSGVWFGTLNGAGANDNTINTDNTAAFCSMTQCPRTGIEDSGQSNLTIVNCLSTAGTINGTFGTPCILNNADLAGCEVTFKNNIIVDLKNATEVVMDMTTPANIAFTASNNIYYAASRGTPGTPDGMYTANRTVNNTFATWKTIAWGPGAAVADANSRVINPQIRAGGEPTMYSPAVGGGAAITGYTHDLNGKPITKWPIGPFLAN